MNKTAVELCEAAARWRRLAYLQTDDRARTAILAEAVELETLAAALEAEQDPGQETTNRRISTWLSV